MPTSVKETSVAVTLNNPPIQEAWIGFTFQPNAKKQQWDMDATRSFLGQVQRDVAAMADCADAATMRHVGYSWPMT
jgi:hypothetical protein